MCNGELGQVEYYWYSNNYFYISGINFYNSLFYFPVIHCSLGQIIEGKNFLFRIFERFFLISEN